MPVEAYAIGIGLVSDASKVVTALDRVIAGLDRVDAAQGRAERSAVSMVQSLKGAGRVADALARSMEVVARFSEQAARASSRIRPPAGVGGGGGAVSAGGPTASRSYVSPFSAAAAVTAVANGSVQPRIGYTGPQALLGYDPVRRDVVRGSTVPQYGSIGPGVTVGSPTTPGGTALVAAGSASGGGGASFRGAAPGYVPPNQGGPSVGALVPYAGGSNGVATRNPGFTLGGGGGGGIPLNPGRLPGSLPFRVPNLGLGAYGRTLAVVGGAETIKGAYEQGFEVDDLVEQLRALRDQGPNGAPVSTFTEAQISQAKDQAQATQRRVPGFGYAQGLDVIRQTAGLFGSDAALALAPQLSLDAQVLSRYGNGDAVTKVEKAVQAGELTGLTGANGKIDVPRLLDVVNRLTRANVRLGGQFDLGKYLTGLKQFGLGADAADLDFTTGTLPVYGKILGEVRAGTALASLQQVLLAPVPKTRSDRYQAEQERIGLRGRTGQRELANAAGLKASPQEYFLQTLLPALNKAGYRSPAEITQEIQRLLPRQTVDRLAGAGIFDRALIEKDTKNILAQQRAGDAPFEQLLAASPGVQVKALSESFKALEAVTTDAAMGPTISILQRLSKTLQNVTDFVKAHPDDVKQFASDVDGVLKVLLGVASVAGKALALLPGPLRHAAEGAIAGAVAGSIVPGVGTAAGAAGGALLGFAGDLSLPRIKGAPGGLNQVAPEDGATVQKQSYETSGSGTHMQPITNIVQIDGRVVARTSRVHQMRRDESGRNGFDPIEFVLRPAVPTVAL